MGRSFYGVYDFTIMRFERWWAGKKIDDLAAIVGIGCSRYHNEKHTNNPIMFPGDQV